MRQGFFKHLTEKANEVFTSNGCGSGGWAKFMKTIRAGNKAKFYSIVTVLFVVTICSFGQTLDPHKGVNGKWGFINKETKQLVVFYKYDEALRFSGGLAAVKFNGKWGYIDKADSAIIAFAYNDARTFSKGMAQVSLNGKWGYIDRNGKEVLPFRYEYHYLPKTRKRITEEIERSAKIEREKAEQLERERKTSFSYFAQNYVEQEINKWQQRGEFERTTDWQERVTAENRKTKEGELLKEAEQAFIEERSRTMPIGNITLDAYNADREVFLIKNNVYGDWSAPVPIDEAPNFRANWNNLAKTPQWVIRNDRLAFAGYKFGTVETVAASTQQTTTGQSTPISGSDTQGTSGTTSTSGTPSTSGDTSSSGTPSVQIGHKGTSVTLSGSDTSSGSSVQVGYKGTSVTISGLESSDTDGSFRKGDKGLGINVPLQVGGGAGINAGIGVKYLYNISNPVRLETSVSYLASTIDFGRYGSIKENVVNIGVNFHFNLMPKNKNTTLYPLVGVSVLYVWSGSDGYVSYDDSDGFKAGLNIGLGSDIRLFGTVYLTNEVRYMLVTGNFSEGIMITEGLVFKF